MSRTLRFFKNYQALSKRGAETWPECKTTKLRRIKETQRKYLESDKPIHLVAGMRDQILYRTTVGLSFFGYFYSIFLVFTNCY